MRERDGGGVLITQAIHTLDLFRWLVGVSRVDAAQVITTGLHRMETEDNAAALVRLGNGHGSSPALQSNSSAGGEEVEIEARKSEIGDPSK